SAKDADRSILVNKLLFFKFALPPHLPTATTPLMHELIQLYISRNDDDIQTLQSQIRPGRPKPTKLLNLEMLKQADQHEYETGMKIPDLTDPKSVTALRNWEGDYNGLHLIKMVDVRAKDATTTTAVGVSEEEMREIAVKAKKVVAEEDGEEMKE
ncbi:hypothetical protein HDV05_002877, partial [Chytridiales sp. JEL 0842]